MIAAPVAAAITNEPPSATRRMTGSTGSFIGWPLIRIGSPASSPSLGGFSARNAPYRIRNVATAKKVNVWPWSRRLVQNTSATPSDSNQSAST